MNERTEDQIRKDISDQIAIQKASAERVDELTVELNTLQTSNMDATVVAAARKLGINPDNFDNDAQLREAIDIKMKEQG